MLPKQARTIVTGLVDIAGMVLFGILSWQTILFALGTRENGELSEVLRIPIAPFAFVVSVGCISLTLVLMADLINVLTRGVKK